MIPPAWEGEVIHVGPLESAALPINGYFHTAWVWGLVVPCFLWGVSELKMVANLKKIEVSDLSKLSKFYCALGILFLPTFSPADRFTCGPESFLFLQNGWAFECFKGQPVYSSLLCSTIFFWLWAFVAWTVFFNLGLLFCSFKEEYDFLNEWMSGKLSPTKNSFDRIKSNPWLEYTVSLQMSPQVFSNVFPIIRDLFIFRRASPSPITVEFLCFWLCAAPIPLAPKQLPCFIASCQKGWDTSPFFKHQRRFRFNNLESTSFKDHGHICFSSLWQFF